MSKYLKIQLGLPFPEIEKDDFKVLHFIFYLASNERVGTGYKELERWGIDPEPLINGGTLSNPTLSGSYAFHYTTYFLNSCFFSAGSVKDYGLDVDCLYNGEDVEQVLYDVNPVGIIPAEEFESYNEYLFSGLSKYRSSNLKGEFSRTIAYSPFKKLVEDQAYKEIKSAMERDKFDNLSSCLKSGFIYKDWEDDVEDKNGFEELYNNYICDQTNKPEE